MCFTGSPEQECQMKTDHFWDTWTNECVSMEADCEKNDGLWVPSDTGGWGECQYSDDTSTQYGCEFMGFTWSGDHCEYGLNVVLAKL